MNEDMRKEMILNKEDINQTNKSVQLSAILSPILYVIDMLARYYSMMLGENYTRRSTLLLLNVQVAFTAVAFPADFSIILRTIFLIWVICSIKLFKRYK